MWAGGSVGVQPSVMAIVLFFHLYCARLILSYYSIL
jgi:hypothetical protein